MAGLISLPCLCATVRRAARTLTAMYDEALREHGMTVTQFTLLQALQLAGPVAQGQLAELLGIDSTTLTRSLGALLKNGWVNRVAGRDRRAWSFSLSKQGEVAFTSALPDWKAAQRKIRKQLGRKEWLKTFHSSDQLTTAVQTIGGSK